MFTLYFDYGYIPYIVSFIYSIKLCLDYISMGFLHDCLMETGCRQLVLKYAFMEHA